jgi:hypothetical protein
VGKHHFAVEVLKAIVTHCFMPAGQSSAVLQVFEHMDEPPPATQTADSHSFSLAQTCPAVLVPRAPTMQQASGSSSLPTFSQRRSLEHSSLAKQSVEPIWAQSVGVEASVAVEASVPEDPALPAEPAEPAEPAVPVEVSAALSAVPESPVPAVPPAPEESFPPLPEESLLEQFAPPAMTGSSTLSASTERYTGCMAKIPAGRPFGGQR